ncbi:MAG: phosphoribosylaminoimidazolesuccinocarboxamide synthase [Candidatus Latescibacterota bacterium]|nr:MAG: phosphoribosylaminoimidazolesuccinocarboxamide synthase [Candidatus Latescibacterota bacterium]
MDALTTVQLPGVPKFSSGKVREIFDLGDELLIVATDRISAFDCVLPTGIPDKGKVLTALSVFWFRFLEDLTEHHLITADVEEFPPSLRQFRDLLDGRSMLVRKAERIDVECVVRGYLAGSGWREYKSSGSVCGILLPEGLREADRLPEPIFTPATKASSGHDENITFGRVADMVGEELAEKLRDRSIALYEKARRYAEERGIIVADTKFEFGLRDGKLILIDEVLTPDSSRFWPKERYSPGRSQESFDKQYVRDYLESLDWDKDPPAPPLSEDVVRRTREKYVEAYRRLVGPWRGG